MSLGRIGWTGALAALLAGLLAPPARGAAVLELVETVENDSYLVAAAAVSPDGANAYVGLDSPPGLAVFARDVATGALTFVQLLQDGEGGVVGVGDPNSITVSPDGADVIATSPASNAIAVFRRDLADGTLTFLEAEIDGTGGVDGLALATESRMSPDGAHVYVAGRGDDVVAVFARDAGSGALTFVEAQGATASHLDEVLSVDVSPDGLHVYAAGSAGDAIFSRDGVTGELSLVHSSATTFPRRAVRVAPDGDHVYMSTDALTFSDGHVRAFARDPATGLLTGIQVIDLGGAEYPLMSSSPLALEVSPDGSQIAVVDANTLLTLVRNAGTGGLTDPDFELIPETGTGVPTFRLAWTPDSGQILVGGAGVGTPIVAAYDAVPGEKNVGEADAFGVIGPSGVDNLAGSVVSPDGAHVYLTSLTAGWFVAGVLAFARDPGTGALTYVETEFDGALGWDRIHGAGAIAVSPDGAHLYLAASNESALTVISRDPVTGAMDLIEVVEQGVAGVDGLAGAQAVAVSPDGAHVYVAGSASDAIAVFARDGGSGTLTFVEAVQDGVGGVDGLEGATGVVVSADGENVYVASLLDDAVAAFARDAATGELGFLEVEREGVAGVTGIDRAAALALSPDDTSVYVAGQDSDALALFDRDPATGALTFHEAYVDSFGGVHGLAGARCVTVSPDGAYVHAQAASFARDAATGALAFIEETANTCPQSFSPDGENLYTQRANAFFGPDEIMVWRLGFSCDATPRPSCRSAQKAKVSVRDSPIPLKRQVSVSLAEADPTTLAELEPGTDNAYGACFYDESGIAPELVLALLVPAGGDCRKDFATLEKPCWKTGKKVAYSDRFLSPEGVNTLKLVPSDAQKAALALVGRGELLPAPGLPWGLPVRLQFQNADGGCWEAELTAASKNDGSTFKAKLP